MNCTIASRVFSIWELLDVSMTPIKFRTHTKLKKNWFNVEQCYFKQYLTSFNNYSSFVIAICLAGGRRGRKPSWGAEGWHENLTGGSILVNYTYVSWKKR